jgi:predicted MFS family arabinose efflux permease
LAFLLTMLSMATVGVIVPLGAEFSAMLGLSKAQFGTALSLFSIPSAIFSLIVGTLCDRIGAKRMLFGGVAIAILADLLLALVKDPLMFRMELFVAGIGFAAIVVTSPVLIIANLEHRARNRALSLWSTYAPVGVSVGLLLAAPFAGTQGWRNVLYIHAALLALTGVAAVYFFRRIRFKAPSARSSLSDMFRVLREPVVVRLALALAVPSALSYGTSLLAPSYIMGTTGVSMASAATMVAVAKIAVVLAGGLIAGWLVTRRGSEWHLFAALVAVGIAGQCLLFYPGSGLVPSLAGLGLWLFAYSGISALVFTVLPVAFQNREQMGAANGLISQVVSCFSFLAPIIYFQPLGWMFFPAICVVGTLAALLTMPRLRARAAITSA